MKRIKLTDLIPDDRNANRHSERGVYMVNTSLAKLGAGRSIVVDKNGKIVAGNLTAEQAADLGIEDVIVVETTGNELVAVMRTDYDLDDPHGPARQYAYADNQAAAVSIDFDPQVIAADLEAGVELGDWFKDFDLQEIGVTAAPDDTYTRKIETPIYTPKGEKPKVSALYDTSRTDELIAEIEAADLPEDEKAFLRIAAQRHTVLDFEQVAEYYAHSSAEVQALMENSALVIVDFNRAIELGFVKLSEKIAEQFAIDYGT